MSTAMCLLKMENLFLTEIKSIVVGVAFPGLANDLNLKDLDMDIDIPETVTITADVKRCNSRNKYYNGFRRADE